MLKLNATHVSSSLSTIATQCQFLSSLTFKAKLAFSPVEEIEKFPSAVAHWRESGKPVSQAKRDVSLFLPSRFSAGPKSPSSRRSSRRSESSRTTLYESNVCFSIRSKEVVSRLRIGLSLGGEVAAATKKDRFV